MCLRTDTEPGGWTIYGSDMNGDGKTDFMTSKGYWEHVGGPMYAQKKLLFGNENTLVVPVDFDGEVPLEIFVAGAWHDYLKWFAYDEEAVAYQENNIPTTLRIFDGDVDGDGDIDVIAGSYGGSAVVWLENDATKNSQSTC